MKSIALGLLVFLTSSVLGEDIIDPLHPFDVNIQTGPDIGKKIRLLQNICG